MIEATKLVKTYGHKQVVDGIDLEVARGRIFGMLGPNGAGKTTCMRMLCGLLSPDSGQVQIGGRPVHEAKHDFGYVAQHFGQYEELTVEENIRFYARLYGAVPSGRIDQVIDRYGLTPFRKQRAGTLSGGYQRRLALACALAHDPSVLFLDEPTAGIDPVTRKRLWDEFFDLSAEGKTLLVSTHYMEEAQRCHELAFLSHGRMVAQGTPSTIREALPDVAVYIAKVSHVPGLQEEMLRLPGILLLNPFGDELRIVVENEVTPPLLEARLEQILGRSVPLVLGELNLEDLFIALTREQEAAS